MFLSRKNEGPRFSYGKELSIDLNTVHPTLRDDMAKEIAYLNKTYPLFGGSEIGLMVLPDFCPDGPNDCKVEDRRELEGSGLTNTNFISRQFSITLNSKDFGVDADMVRAKKIADESFAVRFHGSMMNETYVLSHEYGHVISGMIRIAFAKDQGVYRDVAGAEDMRREVEGFIQYWYDHNDMLDVLLSSIARKQPVPNMKNAHRLVSGYAMVDPEEYFAETFATLCWSTDPADLQLPSVKAMRQMLSVVYGFIRKQEQSNV